jgi:DNA mismatch repair ATPase MutS
MLLRTDEQTITDLGIFSKRNGTGIFDIYNHVHTRGGESLLEQMFRHPLSDATAINKRSSIIGHFADLNTLFPYNASIFDMAEKYLSGPGEKQQHSSGASLMGEKEIQQGVSAIIQLFHLTKDFIERKEIKEISSWSDERKDIAALLMAPSFHPVWQEEPKGKLSYAATTAFDALFRMNERKKLESLLHYLYMLDIYLSVAKTASGRQFVFPKALPKGDPVLRVEGIYHPSLKEAVGNDISMDANENVLFLTGANMAGKSTFLRAVSTALYLAHMGFPVAARSMEFSVMDGIYTTINLPDNLGIGASHFYAEVLRVKKIASELSSGRSYFILFDELFRGTNVKDAHEATVAVMKGFAGKRKSLFIVSSHIVEAGEQLQGKKQIGYSYLPTRMNGHTPEYTYKLEQGITDDRHGMIIIRNEGILDILQNGRKQ